jgi:hypothetical protein
LTSRTRASRWSARPRRCTAATPASTGLQPDGTLRVNARARSRRRLRHAGELGQLARLGSALTGQPATAPALRWCAARPS